MVHVAYIKVKNTQNRIKGGKVYKKIRFNQIEQSNVKKAVSNKSQTKERKIVILMKRRVMQYK